MKLSDVDKKTTSLLDKLKDNSGIKWTNKHDCPPGYTFNEEGWVETMIPFPKITVNFLPHLVYKLGEYKVLLQNLLALRLLNDVPHHVLESALRNRYIQANLGREPSPEIFADAVAASRNITNSSQLPTISEEIVRFDTIWYDSECGEGTRATIKKLIRNNYISAVRELMPIAKKYKTKAVLEETEVSKYALNVYWKELGLNASNRTLSSIVEAVQALNDNGSIVTPETVKKIAGVSVRSIQRYKNMWELEMKENNER